MVSHGAEVAQGQQLPPPAEKMADPLSPWPWAKAIFLHRYNLSKNRESVLLVFQDGSN